MTTCPGTAVRADGSIDVVPFDLRVVRLMPQRRHASLTLPSTWASSSTNRRWASFSSDRTDDGMGTVQTKRYLYTRKSEGRPNASSGVILREPRYHYRTPLGVSNCKYLSRSSRSRLPLGITQGSAIGYTEVTVLYDPDGSGNPQSGSSTHRFRTAEIQSAKDVTLSEREWPYVARTSRDWKRGQLIERLDYDASGTLVERVEKAYGFVEDNSEATHRYRGLSFQNLAGGIYAYSMFEILSGWTYPTSETVTTYDAQTGASESTTTTYTYETNSSDPAFTQLRSVTTSSSNAPTRTTEYEYAQE